jgi:hypothetical protein
MDDREYRLERLVEALRLLAADFDRQVELFPAFVHIPDELALTLHDCFLLIRDGLGESLLGSQAFAEIQTIDERLGRMSGGETPHFWSLRALQESPEWQEIRNQATRVLQNLGREPQIERIRWARYMESR